jgi:DNA-binding NtrC family response regulator
MHPSVFICYRFAIAGTLLALIEHYIRYFNVRFGRHVERLSDDAMQCFPAHEWPGNVRELKNAIEGIFVELRSEEVRYLQLPPMVRHQLVRVKEASGDERDLLIMGPLGHQLEQEQGCRKVELVADDTVQEDARYQMQQSHNCVTTVTPWYKSCYTACSVRLAGTSSVTVEVQKRKHM